MNDEIIIAGSKVAQYGGSAGALIFGLSLEQVAAIFGVVVALAGYGTNVYFQWRKDRREERFLRLKGMPADLDAPDTDKAGL
jgi:hypothetical protein